MIPDFRILVRPTTLKKLENSYEKNSLVNTSRSILTLFVHVKVNLKNANVLLFVMEARTCKISSIFHDLNQLNLVVGISQNNSSKRVWRVSYVISVTTRIGLQIMIN